MGTVRDLLVLSHTYNDFIKDQVECLSPYIDDISVVVRYNAYVKLLSRLPLKTFNKYIPSRHLDIHKKPNNVDVIPAYVRCFTMGRLYRNAGDPHYRSAASAVKNIAYELIHSHFIWSSGYVGSRLKAETGTPHIVTAHGYDLYDLPFRDRSWNLLIRGILDSADHLITVSKSNLEYVHRLGVRAPVTVVPNGYRSDLFHPMDRESCRKSLGLPVNRKIVLSIGNLADIKGHGFLIKAMPQVMEKEKDALCMIIGSGENFYHYRSLVKKLGMDQQVFILGQRPHHEIPLWINACDLFVMPSLRESFGVAQVEAMACGKPVVSTHNGGSDDIIISDDLGYLATPGDTDQLAEYICRSLSRKWDPGTITGYADQYRQERLSSKLLEIYQKYV